MILFSYKQVKFNLLREESEGYGKLITELLSLQRSATNDGILLTVERLIGLNLIIFNLH